MRAVHVEPVGLFLLAARFHNDGSAHLRHDRLLYRLGLRSAPAFRSPRAACGASDRDGVADFPDAGDITIGVAHRDQNDRLVQHCPAQTTRAHRACGLMPTKPGTVSFTPNMCWWRRSPQGRLPRSPRKLSGWDGRQPEVIKALVEETQNLLQNGL